MNASIDYGKTIRFARALANRADVLDPENLAGDMLEEVLRAVAAGRIAAPSMRALRYARTVCMSRLRFADRNTELRELSPHLAGEIDVERLVDGRLTLSRLQALWPNLNQSAQEGMRRFLLGEVTKGHSERKEDRRTVVRLSAARGRVISRLRQSALLAPEAVSCA